MVIITVAWNGIDFRDWKDSKGHFYDDDREMLITVFASTVGWLALWPVLRLYTYYILFNGSPSEQEHLCSVMARPKDKTYLSMSI